MIKYKKLMSMRRKNIFNCIKIVIAGSCLAAAICFAINYGYASFVLQTFPAKQLNPKTITLRCTYGGKNIELKETLYQNIANYYKNYDFFKRSKYLKNEEFDQFVYSNSKDRTIAKIAADIKATAKENNLNDDQTMELTTCFIQNIPYDHQKGEEVLSGGGNTPSTEQLPYHTLYEEKGICTDKTYLGSALLKEMGYGVGMMVFEDHMSLGVSVPSGYSSFNSKYAIMELTNIGFAPGQIPAEILKNGLPNSSLNNIKPLSNNDNPSDINLNLDKAINGPMKIIDISSGKYYTRIVAVKSLEEKIKNTLEALEQKKIALEKSYQNVENLELGQDQAYQNYLRVSHSPNGLSVYDQYQSAYNSYKSSVDSYNAEVLAYNSILEAVNKDIETYKSYQYNY